MHLLAARPEVGELVRLDADTVMNDGTWPAVCARRGRRRARGRPVVGRRPSNAFVATRPPGHHAETVQRHGLLLPQQRRHRGAPCSGGARHANGSRSSISTSTTATAPRTSSGTTPRSSTARPTRCRSIPAPARPGSAGPRHDRQRAAACRRWRRGVPGRDGGPDLAAARRFAPDLVILSAGFDAHRRDPLASLTLVEADFAWVTRRLLDVADRHRRAAGSCRCSKAATISRAGRIGSRACRGTDGRARRKHSG